MLQKDTAASAAHGSKEKTEKEAVMLTFKPAAQRDVARLRRYYKNCDYQLCEYSALVKLMWREHLHPNWAEGAGCLIVRNFIDGQYCFDYPVPDTAEPGIVEILLSAEAE